MDIILVQTVRFAFKVELVIVTDDHGEAVTIEVVVFEANEAVVFDVAVVFFIILRSDSCERGGGISNSLWLLIKESVTFIKPSRSVTTNMPSCDP